jgi:putative methanogenesis marker protein 12
MARRARLYLLDEPIAGVDPAARDYILQTIIGSYNPEATVVITTHLIHDIEPILDEFAFMGYGGHILLSGNADEVRADRGKSLDELFRAAYSHQASPEKVSISYNALKETGWSNFIVADISSNSVDILIENGKIKGAIDACLGAMGVVHGPLDLEMIRDIDEGKRTANECFSHAGAVKIAGIDDKVAFMKDDLLNNYRNGDEKAKLAIDTLIMTVAMEIAGLDVVCENEIEGIVLTGSIGSATEPFNFENEINKYFKNKYPLKSISKESGAIGAAQIARDIAHGKREIMGIKVEL